MKTSNIVLTGLAMIALIVLTVPGTQAQTCTGDGTNFIDLNGDGFNDNAPDHDADGIPNGLDDDYTKNAQDGSGYQKGKMGENAGDGTGRMSQAQKFERRQNFEGTMTQNRVGAGGGMNGSGSRLRDGSGGGTGTGTCDGTGPHGGQNGR